MLYEMVTVEVRPGAVGEAVKRIAEKPPVTDGGATLLGFWVTEIGRVNELVSLWARADQAAAAERDGLKAGEWLAAAAEFVTDMKSRASASSPSWPTSRRVATAASTSCAAIS